MERLLLLVCATILTGCDGIPADPDHTSERVRAEGRYQVGLIAPADVPSAALEQAFLAHVSQAAGARAVIEADAAEPLLLRLEEGDLDLVIGRVAADSPWRTRVSPLPPLADAQGGAIELTAFARNGENRWIALLDRQARARAEQP